jgi:tetratricopeptide (TPR) repeat protein
MTVQMSNDDVLKGISADINSGRTEGLTDRISELADSTDDPFEVLKYMSLLKLIPRDGTESKLANRVVSMSDQSNGLALATGLRNLDCHIFALDILKKLEPTDQVERLRCHCLYDIEEYESAMETYYKIKAPVINDRILLSNILSSVGEHRKAIEAAEQLLSEYPNDYDVRIAYVRALMMGGNNKEALKYARAGLKDKSADSNAVAAYVLRVQGNIKAAGGYAARAVQLNNSHIGAMESLGICLALKGEIEKAKITAGAINEISPGDKAAINILSYCDGN